MNKIKFIFIVEKLVENRHKQGDELPQAASEIKESLMARNAGDVEEK